MAQAYLKERADLGEDITIEQAREAVGKFSVLSGELSEKAKASRRKFNKALNALDGMSGLRTSFVIVEPNDTFNASVVDGALKVDNRIYIGADTFENDTWQKALIHEYTHLEEGSEEYFKMYDFLQSDDILVDVQTDTGTQKIPLWQKIQADVYGKNYGFEENKIKDIKEKLDNDQEISAEETKLYMAFETEIAAHETEYLLGNEAFIDKIVAKDASFAKRIMKKIADLKKAFEKSGDTKSKAEIKQLEQAEKFYLAAAQKADGARLRAYIMGQAPEEEDGVDTEESFVSTFSLQKASATESKEIINIINSKLNEIPSEIFDIEYNDEARTYQSKIEYVLDIFNSQGNVATNPQIGKVELVKSGAKSTIMHGYGNLKLSAVNAIKPTIEQGSIISTSKNYEGKGYDRYIIAAKGKINGSDTIIGAVIKSYPQSNTPSKFYLHEAEIIEADLSSMTAPQLSVDTVNKSASTNSISQNSQDVNTFSKKSSNGTKYSLKEVDDMKVLSNSLKAEVADSRKPYHYELTGGKVKQNAEYTREKVYTKKEAEGIINDIIGRFMSFGEEYGVFSGKPRSEAIEMLWRGLNAAEPGMRGKVALDLTEYLLKYTAVKNIQENPELDVYRETFVLFSKKYFIFFTKCVIIKYNILRG